MTEKRVVIVGAGVGGLTAGALLARAGLDVTVLEAHIYPGGCAGTFYHQGYRFDAGATLAAGFGANGGMERIGEALGITWPVVRPDIAMQVHLPDGDSVTRWTDAERWQEARAKAFGVDSEPFWRWQERTADLLWDAILRVPVDGLPWPPASGREWGKLVKAGAQVATASRGRLPLLALDAVRPVSAHMGGASHRLRSYVDGQLLISAQTTSERANALYGAAALDMPRRGVAHLKGGMGAVAELLAGAVRRHGGQVLYRQRVTRVITADGARAIITGKGNTFPADVVLFNLSPWDAAALLDETPRLAARETPPVDGWGAFMMYAGVDDSVVPLDAVLHRQVLVRQPFGEGNSVFVSLSLPDDSLRAPRGQRAVTISTHTRLGPWWQLHESDLAAYEARKQEYTDRVLDAAEIALPGLRRAVRLAIPGTPVSFQRFTHRSGGWVGGFPQTSLTRSRSPRLAAGLWLIGDSIFPGQSVLSVALGAARVAEAVRTSGLTESRRPRVDPSKSGQGMAAAAANGPHRLESSVP
jgi:C-3',4' desaturase CrtD